MSGIPYIFIASSPFSGSTLLSFLLGLHPKIAVVSAVAGSIREEIIDTYLCTCGKRMLDCEFWTAVRARMHQRGFTDFDLANFELNFALHDSLIGRLQMGSGKPLVIEALRDAVFRFWPDHVSHVHRLSKRTLAFTEEVLAESGRQVFVDATKEPSRIKHLAKYVDVELSVIHLVRNVRGNVSSHLRRKAKQGITVEDATRKWIRENSIISRDLALLPPERRTFVTYEELCQNTQDTMKRLFKFCGVDESVSVENFREHTQHLLGNEMRLRTSSEIRVDERWREMLSTNDLSLIDHLAGPLEKRIYQS